MHQSDLFGKLKDNLLSFDPIYFIQNNLTLDGKPFRLYGNGYRPFADIYRYIGIQALNPNSKPVVLVKGRQVGATTMAAAISLFFCASGVFGQNGRAPMRVMHAFPYLDWSYYYAKTKLNPMITSAVKDEVLAKGKPKSRIENKIDRTASANDSLNFKQFLDGNHIQIDSTGLTADRLRGRTIDAILMDECQDMTRSAIVNAAQILSKAQYGPPGKGIQVLFGTPKQKGTVYWDIWQNSTQQYYYLGCEKCEEYFPLYSPESDEWEEIWIDDDLPPGHEKHGFIVRCTHCEHEQDKREAAERGKWVATRPESESQYVGFHINQLYMPDFRKEDIISKKPENNVEYTERAYMNEILGEFYAGDAAPLTPEEIREFCGDNDRAFSERIPLSSSKRVYAGFDWGERVDMSQFAGANGQEKKMRGQSYSSCVVVSVEGSGLMNIEYARLLKRNDPAYKKAFVDEVFRRFSITRAVGDLGYAGDLTHDLHQDYGERFLGAWAVGSLKNHVKFDPDQFPQLITFEKNYFIEQLIDMMKRGQIRFPFKSYEKIAWLVTHCSSMEIKPTMDRAGNIKVNYVKGSTPNDGMMSLLYARLASMFDSTYQFSVLHPDRQKDVSKPDRPAAITAHLPGVGNPSKRGQQLNATPHPYRK